KGMLGANGVPVHIERRTSDRAEPVTTNSAKWGCPWTLPNGFYHTPILSSASDIECSWRFRSTSIPITAASRSNSEGCHTVPHATQRASNVCPVYLDRLNLSADERISSPSICEYT